MTFLELENEDYAFKQFEYLKISLSVQNQLPVRVIRIDNFKTSKFIIIKQSQRGMKCLTTKQFNLPKEDSMYFTSWLSTEFPELEIEFIKVGV